MLLEACGTAQRGRSCCRGYHGVLLIVYRAAAQRPLVSRWLTGTGTLARHQLGRDVPLTCYGWLIFRARSADQLRAFTSSLFSISRRKPSIRQPSSSCCFTPPRCS